MRLQFAFGANPRKKRTKKKVVKRSRKNKNKKVVKTLRGNMAKKKVKRKAKKKVVRRKKAKTIKQLPAALDKALSVSKQKRKSKAQRAKAKKTYKALYKRIKKKSGRNPYVLNITKGDLNIKTKVRTKKEFDAYDNALYEADKKAAQGDYTKLNQAVGQRRQRQNDYLKELQNLRKQARRYSKEGAEIEYYYEAPKGSKAQKPESEESASKKAKAKKAKAKKTFTKGGKRYTAHTHLSTTRHVKKGATASVSLTKKKKARTFKGKGRFGKKGAKFSVTVTPKKKGFLAKLKFNPFRRNAMAIGVSAISDVVEQYTGISAGDAGGFVIGGALVPTTNMILARIAPGIVAQVNSIAGPLGAGVIVPGIVGAGMYTLGEGQIAKAGRGMVVASLVMASVSVAQAYLPRLISMLPGMSGVLFTPRMSGINYTPAMSGINYTPDRQMGIMPQLGAGPDFGSADYGGGGGYTQAHKMSRADFGADWSQDSEAEHWGTEEDMLSSQMSGSMG